MRLLFSTIAMVCAVLLFAPAQTSAQFDLGKALGQLMSQGAHVEQDATPSPYDRLRENAPAKSKLLGTWQYKGAAIEYLGDNPLADVALEQVETFGLAELKKLGVVEGCCSITLRRNGLAVVATLDTIQEGRFTYDESDASVVISSEYGGNKYSSDGYVKIVNDRLIVMVDARDVMSEVLRTSPELATNQSVATMKTLLDSFGDVYVSVMFER